MRRLLLLASLLLFAAATVSAGEPVRVPVSEIDTLRYDNLALRMANHRLEVDRLQRDLTGRAAELAAAREAMNTEWLARYGVAADAIIRDAQGFVKRETP